MSQLSDLSDLMSLIQGVQGQTQTTRQTGGTTTQRQTQRTDVSDQGVQELIQQILEGQGGVRSIGNAARSAGVYDSTTEDLLYGNLYSRAANQAELARSPTVTETETDTPEMIQTTEIPGMAGGLGGLAPVLAGTSALSSIMRNEVPFTGMMGGEARTLAGEGGVLNSILGRGGNAARGGAAAGGQNFLSDTVTGGTQSGLGVQGGVSSGAIDAATNIAGSSGAGATSGFMGEVATGGARTGGATTAASAGGATGAMGAAGSFLRSNAMPLGGSFISGLLGGKDARDPMSLGLNAAMGAFTMGPIGLAAAPAAAVLGSILGGSGTRSIERGISSGLSSIGSAGRSVGRGVRRAGRSIGRAVGTVICTALMYRGLLDKEEYRTALRLMHELHPTALRGYHYWAVGVAHKIRQGHKVHTAIWKPIMRSRMKLLASGGGFANHCRYPLGTGTKYILEPGCYMIGKLLELRDQFTGESNYGRN